MTDDRPPLRVVVVDRFPPVDATNGASLIARELLPHLARHDLTYVCPVAPARSDEVRAALDGIVPDLRLVPRRAPFPAMRGWAEGRLAARGVRLPGPLDPREARALLAAVHAAVAERPVDVVHTRGLPMAATTAAVRGPFGTLLELIDSSALATRRDPVRTLRGRLRHRLFRSMERRAVPAFDLTTVVSPVDAAYLRRLVPGARIEVVPNGVDAERFRPGGRPTREATIVVTGAMSYRVNVDAARWLATGVLPLVRARAPEATLRVVGRDPTPEAAALGERPGVVVTGSVDDIVEELDRAAVVAVPMVSGSGIKNKLLEALAVGRPVVTTSLGAEGVDLVPGRDALVADGPVAFADAVVRLLADPEEAARLGAAGRRLVTERYTWAAAARRYEEMYRALAPASRSVGPAPAVAPPER